MLTAEEAREKWDLDVEAGIFRWVHPKSRRLKHGDIAGSRCRAGKKTYIRIGSHGKLFLAHRMIFLVVNGEWPLCKVDHIDGDGTNNRWENLRLAPYLENHQNRKRYSSNKSGCSGVTWHRWSKRWIARITVGKTIIHLGCYIHKKDAIAARVAANVKYGFHTNHGIERNYRYSSESAC